MQSAVSRLGLAMGRFALPSPITGRRPGPAQAFAAVALAADAGVSLIDCPPDPEDAERILGQALPAAPAFDLVVRAAPLDEPQAVVRRLRTSLRRLKREHAAAVLARPGALLGPNGDALWGALLRLRDEGLVGAAGIAACVCDNPVGLARRFRPDLMQLPLSLLDQRLLASGALAEIAARGVTLHLRSIFAHGLLFFDPPVPASVGAGQAPSHTPPQALPPHVARLRRRLAEAGADPMQAALAFALGQPLAERVVVGVGSAAEVTALLRAARAPLPDLDWSHLGVSKLDGPEGATMEAGAACPLQPARCRAA